MQVTQLKIVSNPFAKGFRDNDTNDEWVEKEKVSSFISWTRGCFVFVKAGEQKQKMCKLYIFSVSMMNEELERKKEKENIFGECHWI